MGAASSLRSSKNNHDVNIELDDARVYNPGDVVSGTLHVNYKDPENKSVSMDLIGEFGFSVLQPSAFTPATQNVEYHVPFYKVSLLSIKNGEKFSFNLNEQLPPAVNLALESYPYIQYFLAVNLCKKKQYRHYIIVCPRVSIPHSIVQSQQFDAANHKEMHLQGSIDRNWILPGQTLHINFQIKNPHHKHIKYISGNIFMKGEFKKGECTEKVIDFTADNIKDTNNEHIDGVVSVTIPSRYLSPTFTYTNQEHHFDVNINYWIVIEMHIRDLFSTISTTIPLSMGFESEKIIFEEQFNPQCHCAISFID